MKTFQAIAILFLLSMFIVAMLQLPCAAKMNAAGETEDEKGLIYDGCFWWLTPDGFIMEELGQVWNYLFGWIWNNGIDWDYYLGPYW